MLRSRFDSLLADIRYSLRMLLRMPGFTLVAVLTLMLGIGANSVIFSIVNMLLFRPLPVNDPARLVQLHPGMSHTSYPTYQDIRQFGRDHGLFVDVAGYRNQSFNLGEKNNAERIFGEMVTGNYFQLLGVQAQQGRLFGPEVDTGEDAHEVAVISQGFWKRMLGERSDAVGSAINLNGRKFTVVGITPAEFHGTFPFGFVPDVYVPMSMYTSIVPRHSALQDRTQHIVQMFARLQPRVTAGQATAAIATFGAQLEKQYPEIPHTLSNTRLYSLDGLGSFQGMSFAPIVFGFLGLLTALVAIVLLIACANLANLLLARAWNRRKEVAIRAALGAPRARLAQQFLTESVMLSLLGGVAACLLASWLTDLARGIRPPVPMPLELNLSFDWRVLGFTAAISVITGLVFGSAPAWKLSRPDLNEVIKEGSHAFDGAHKRFSFRRLLVVGQVAASLVLLVCAGLFLRSLNHSKFLNPGFNPDLVLDASIDLQASGYDQPRGWLLIEDLLNRVRSIPGVKSATAASVVPLSLSAKEMPLQVEGSQNKRGIPVLFNQVTSDYFKTLGIPVLAGREFSSGDRPGSPAVTVVNRTFAHAAWGDQNPIGKHVRGFAGLGKWGDWIEVVGVVADSKYRTPGEDPQPIAYLALSQSYDNDVVLQARVSGDPAAFRTQLRQAILSADPKLVPQISIMREDVMLSLIPARIAAGLLGTLGLLGLVLASIGIYGVISYSASQRTHEVGVRVALGAKPKDIFRLIVGEGLVLAMAGLAIGLVIAGLISQFLSSMLAGISPLDPLTYAAVAMLLIGIAAIASFLPALRSVKVDPMVALRVE